VCVLVDQSEHQNWPGVVFNSIINNNFVSMVYPTFAKNSKTTSIPNLMDLPIFGMYELIHVFKYPMSIILSRSSILEKKKRIAVNLGFPFVITQCI